MRDGSKLYLDEAYTLLHDRMCCVLILYRAIDSLRFWQSLTMICVPTKARVERSNDEV